MCCWFSPIRQGAYNSSANVHPKPGPVIMRLDLLNPILFLLVGLEILPPSNVLAVVTDKILGVLTHNFFLYGGAFWTAFWTNSICSNHFYPLCVLVWSAFLVLRLLRQKCGMGKREKTVTSARRLRTSRQCVYGLSGYGLDRWQPTALGQHRTFNLGVRSVRSRSPLRSHLIAPARWPVASWRRWIRLQHGLRVNPGGSLIHSIGAVFW